MSVRKLFGAALLALGLIAAGAPATVAATPAVDISWPRGGPVELEVNAGSMLRLPSPVSSVFVANPDIADVQVKSPRLIYIFAKQPGETTIYAVDRSEEVVVNHRLVVGHNLTRLRELIHRVRPEADIDVSSLNGAVVLTGVVSSAERAEDVRSLAAQVLGESGALINRIRVATPQQVNLRVRIAEVSRDVSKQLGFDWNAAQSFGSLALGLATGSFVNGLTSGTQQLAGAFTSGNTSVNLLIDALDEQGLITVLAEPNLTALTGETANFLAGGEFPIPVPQDDGTITVAFKKFGVGLSFLPVVLDDARIHMKIVSEVSQLSAAGAVSFSGFSIPALTTRQAETTVNLGSGQSFAIAGLLQNTTNQTVERFPGLGDIPVLGALFRSSRFQNEQSELLVIVTPYLVRPVSTQIAAPTDGFQPPSDADRVIHGHLYSQAPASRHSAMVDVQGRQGQVGQAGFILR